MFNVGNGIVAGGFDLTGQAVFSPGAASDTDSSARSDAFSPRFSQLHFRDNHPSSPNTLPSIFASASTPQTSREPPGFRSSVSTGSTASSSKSPVQGPLMAWTTSIGDTRDTRAISGASYGRTPQWDTDDISSLAQSIRGKVNERSRQAQETQGSRARGDSLGGSTYFKRTPNTSREDALLGTLSTESTVLTADDTVVPLTTTALATDHIFDDHSADALASKALRGVSMHGPHSKSDRPSIVSSPARSVLSPGNQQSSHSFISGMSSEGRGTGATSDGEMLITPTDLTVEELVLLQRSGRLRVVVPVLSEADQVLARLQLSSPQPFRTNELRHTASFASASSAIGTQRSPILMSVIPSDMAATLQAAVSKSSFLPPLDLSAGNGARHRPSISSPVPSCDSPLGSGKLHLGLSGKTLGLSLDRNIFASDVADVRAFDESGSLHIPPARDRGLSFGSPRGTAPAASSTPVARTSTMPTHHTIGRGRKPSDVQISDSGSVEVGELAVREQGIFVPSAEASPLPNEVVDGSGRALTGLNFKDVSVRIGQLGQGACGTVFKIVHVPTLTLLAAKTIPVFDAQKRHSIASELTALYTNLTPFGPQQRAGTLPVRAPCPYIVSFYDAFVNPAEGLLTFVVEYMDGGSLQDIVDHGGTKSEHVLASIAWRVLKGLRFIHEKHIIHRDIKPSNILINHLGEVKITDFGINREMEHTKDFASTFIGTYTYMSPERILGNAYSYASDIWSMGLSILACALGSYPYRTTTFWGVTEMLEKSEPPLPPAGKFSEEFIDFIRLCLTKDPALRPTAGQLLLHPFVSRCALDPGANSTGAASSTDTVKAGAMQELKDIVHMVQEFRYVAASRNHQKCLESIAPERFTELGYALGVPPEKVAKYFNKLQAKMDDLLRKASEPAASHLHKDGDRAVAKQVGVLPSPPSGSAAISISRKNSDARKPPAPSQLLRASAMATAEATARLPDTVRSAPIPPAATRPVVETPMQAQALGSIPGLATSSSRM